LIGSGQLRLAMELALELMKQGSYQVEMSDEGIMTEEIEACLSVVLQALKKSDLPADEISAWCAAMLDRARHMLITEFSISRGLSENEAIDTLQRSLAKAMLCLPPAL